MGVATAGEPGRGILRLGGRSPVFAFLGFVDSASTPGAISQRQGGRLPLTIRGSMFIGFDHLL